MWYILIIIYYEFITYKKNWGGTVLRKHVSPVIFTAILSGFVLAGCGNDQKTNELSIYQASMETFCDNIAYINDQINALDGSGESDVTELL